MNFKKTQLSFWLLSLSIVLALTLPTLIQDGMFMDGMYFTCVAKNYAHGIGSFWFPVFDKYGVGGFTTFHEQPPFAFFIQSLFFNLFGDSMYTERIYVLFIMLITVILMFLIWNLSLKNSNERIIAWFPIIIWIIIPVCFWSFSNNALEITMGIFILLAVLLFFKSLDKNKMSILYIFISAISIFFATFTKGFPGLFPIAIPFIYWLCFKKISFSKMSLYTFILFVIPIAIWAFLFLFPTSNLSLSHYLFDRALYRINEVPTVNSHFYIFYRLLSELIPSVTVVLIILLLFKFTIHYLPSKETLRTSLFFILIGFVGSAPLMLTKVQKGFYFLPSLPFFAIGLSLLVSKPIANWTLEFAKTKKNTILTFFTATLLVSVLIYSSTKIGSQSRDKSKLHDIYLMGNQIGKNNVASVNDAMWNDWSLHCYFVRYFNISLESSISKNEFLILNKKMFDNRLKDYKKVNLNTQTYELYQRK